MKDFGYKQAKQGNGGTEEDGQQQEEVLINSSEINGNKVGWQKTHPNDAERVHSDVDVFCFIEVVRHFPGKECKVGAEEEEEKVVNKGDRETKVRRLATS